MRRSSAVTPVAASLREASPASRPPSPRRRFGERAGAARERGGHVCRKRVRRHRLAERGGYGRSGRGGFTLLEVVIAATLMTLVFAAVFQAITLVYRAETTVNERLTDVQVVAAVTDRLRRDIDALVQPAEVTVESDLMIDDGEEPIEAEAAETTGVFSGTADQLLIVAEPAQTVGEAAADGYLIGTGGTGPRRRLITWGRDPETAVVRTEAYSDAVALEVVDLKTLDVPEIASMSFRYGKAGDFYDEWDDVELIELPDTVEVTLTLLSNGVDRGEDAEAFTRMILVPAGRFPPPPETSSDETEEAL